MLKQAKLYIEVFTYRVKKVFQFIRWGWYDEDWDYFHLLKLEQNKLKAMADAFEKDDFFEGCDFVVRDMRLCVALLDIVMVESSCYNIMGYGKNAKYIKTHKVNVRNALRFLSKEDVEMYFGKDQFEPYRLLREDDLRQKKAWFLYCQIRKDHLMEWWY